MVLNSSNGATCPNCQALCRTGELICPNCGKLVSPAGAIAGTAPMAVGSTQVLKVSDLAGAAGVNKAGGAVFIDSQKQITLEIRKERMVLPVADSVIIGRMDEPGQPSQPDIGLNEFDAANCGVSRQHIKITRQSDMIYVTDLGSRNGTYLNHRHILPNTKHILRSGDELRLGNLSFRVSF